MVFVASSRHRAPLTLKISWVIWVREVSFVIHIKPLSTTQEFLLMKDSGRMRACPWTPFQGERRGGGGWGQPVSTDLITCTPCAGSSRKPSLRGSESFQAVEHVRCRKGGAPRERPELHGLPHCLALGTSSSWPFSSCVPIISQTSSWGVPLSSGAVLAQYLPRGGACGNGRQADGLEGRVPWRVIGVWSGAVCGPQPWAVRSASTPGSVRMGLDPRKSVGVCRELESCLEQVVWGWGWVLGNQWVSAEDWRAAWNR